MLMRSSAISAYGVSYGFLVLMRIILLFRFVGHMELARVSGIAMVLPGMECCDLW